MSRSRDDERERVVDEVVEKFRALESGPAGGVSVSLPGAPDALPVYAGGAGAFTPAATALLRALWELTKYPEGQAILIEAYKRFELEEEDI
jgi:hypothetical protein